MLRHLASTVGFTWRVARRGAPLAMGGSIALAALGCGTPDLVCDVSEREEVELSVTKPFSGALSAEGITRSYEITATGLAQPLTDISTGGVYVNVQVAAPEGVVYLRTSLSGPNDSRSEWGTGFDNIPVLPRCNDDRKEDCCPLDADSCTETVTLSIAPDARVLEGTEVSWELVLDTTTATCVDEGVVLDVQESSP